MIMNYGLTITDYGLWNYELRNYELRDYELQKFDFEFYKQEIDWIMT